MSKPYRAEVDTEGCPMCAAGRTWCIVGPDDVAGSTSWEDVEFADELADLLNTAYERGLASVQKYAQHLEDCAQRTGEMGVGGRCFSPNCTCGLDA